MLNFLGDVIVNGNPDVKIINPNKKLIKPQVPKFDGQAAYPKGTKDLLTELGPEEFSKWLSKEKKIHYTDTTMRDAHQSLLAIEAMKMGTTICANTDGKVKKIYLKEGTMVHSDDLVVEME